MASLRRDGLAAGALASGTERTSSTARRLRPSPRACSVSSSRWRRARAISSAICAISGSVIPCVVTAGVPMRTPLVTKGERGSSGIVFLFNVMPARSSVSCAILPVSSLSNVRRSTSSKWLSVPPDTSRNPSAARPAASACAFFTICAAYSLKLGCAASWNATAFAAITCSSGPPCRPGNIGLVDRRGVLGRRDDAAATRAAERLVRGEGDDVGVRHR